MVVWAPALPAFVLLYLAVLAIVGLATVRAAWPVRLVFPLAVTTMHLGYGIGSWVAILQGRWRS
jgi:hypothetical protein